MAIAAKMATMAITVNSSITVIPACECLVISISILGT